MTDTTWSFSDWNWNCKDWRMALAANPFCLSQEQYIISSSSVAKSGLASDGRFHRRQRLHFHGAVLFKFWPNSRKLRYIQSIRSHRHHYGGVIRCSNHLSDWTKKFSSLCSSSSRSMPKVNSWMMLVYFVFNVEIVN